MDLEGKNWALNGKCPEQANSEMGHEFVGARGWGRGWGQLMGIGFLLGQWKVLELVELVAVQHCGGAGVAELHRSR